MINIDFSRLNPLEQEIHEKLKTLSKKEETIRISQAADYCGCSESKISKFVKKLGFNNYKLYLDFLYERALPESGQSSELKRIRNFINDFDNDKVDDIKSLIEEHEKIVLFGYGPSFLCAQYFEYRLRNCTNKVIMAINDEISIDSMTDENTLLIIFTVTGTFRSFENIYNKTKQKGCDVAIVVEEFNSALFSQCDNIFFLAKENQPVHLQPYEKSRTIFFIFMEEVIQSLMNS